MSHVVPGQELQGARRIPSLRGGPDSFAEVPVFDFPTALPTPSVSLGDSAPGRLGGGRKGGEGAREGEGGAGSWVGFPDG